jgi:DNA-binding transcriptional MerR regulator
LFGCFWRSNFILWLLTSKLLREYDFSLAEIKEILDECEEESEILQHLQTKLKSIQDKINRYKEISHSIEAIIQ